MVSETEPQWGQEDYAARTASMESWYSDLLAHGYDHAERALLADYQPFMGYLERLHGRVIDIGGGAGLVSRFLRPGTEYWVVDPVTSWRSEEWQSFSRRFRGSGPAPHFVDAAGEELPFPDEGFDAALAFWSLNHVRDPQRCVAEMARVLKVGGRAFIVLEDMEPRWPELLRDCAGRIARKLGSKQEALPRRSHVVHGRILPAIMAKLSDRWPLQHDHIRIIDHELIDSAQPRLQLVSRAWLGGYLTLEFKRAGLQECQ